MGAAVSSWRLAREVSSLGQLGVVSGVALDVILARRLQDGDLDGSVRRALAHFPSRAVANRITERYFIEGGRPTGQPYQTVPMHSIASSIALLELCVASAFVEVFLAREGHTNPVGINYLEKIQLPHLPSIYGAMLAGVAFVLMGAGIATRIPGVLEQLAHHQPATYELSVSASVDGLPATVHFDPRSILGDQIDALERPRFIPIVSSNVLAATMIKRSNGPIDGFIIEAPSAGGHNAPPRGRGESSSTGEPVYGAKDEVDLARIRDLGLPFWLAGGRATREKLQDALASGATGIQVGTAFAFCEESGLDPMIRREVVELSCRGAASVFTDPNASPTGFPFKVVQLEGTLSDPSVYEARKRVCDLGVLREIYRTDDGRFGYRCAAEPTAAYMAKGGNERTTVGRQCLCNALVANVGLPQVRPNGTVEKPLVTAGDDVGRIARFLRPGASSYTARDVIESLLG